MKRAQTRNQAYKSIFATVDGKVVLKDLMKFCHLDSPTFIPGDSHTSAYNEGMRRVILRIVGIINMDEEAMLKIMNELNEQRGL